MDRLEIDPIHFAERPPFPANGVRHRRPQHTPRRRIFHSRDLLNRSLRDNRSPEAPRARPEIQDMIGTTQRLLVVLDDNQGVPPFHQSLQGVQQSDIISWMQADRRLIKDVKYPPQVRPQLRSQTDALGLSPTQRSRRTTQPEIAQSHSIHALQALRDLRQDIPRKLCIPPLQTDASRPLQRVHRRHPHDPTNPLPPNLHPSRDAVHPRAVTLRATFQLTLFQTLELTLLVHLDLQRTIQSRVRSRTPNLTVSPTCLTPTVRRVE